MKKTIEIKLNEKIVYVNELKGFEDIALTIRNGKLLHVKTTTNEKVEK
ncbi:MAG: hypothetical protein LBV67_08355 [Streptococcaceae bacterium]|jgi:hypothetical protein|nr:hypothetical protein [Streptococcaceae bacterium]